MKPDKPIELHGSVWMSVDGENFGGASRVALLAKIAECGSITQAAKAIKMSYKGAWDAIDTMNNLAGKPLVERLSGGKGGGGTRLTQRGAQLVENFQVIEREHRAFINQLAAQAEGMADDYLLIRKMGIKTSARNQFLGTVTALKKGAVNDEVELQMPASGQKITATVTHESAESLGLMLGTEVFALIKSSSIIVVTDDEKARFSARNRLSGTVTRIQSGAVSTEVVIELPSGQAVVATVTNDSSQTLGLHVGMVAAAIFKASSVIIGVAA